MATADPNIYAQIRPFSLEDPLTRAAKAQQVHAGNLQIQDAERKFTLEDDISGALSESGGDLGKASQLLAQRGRGTAALSLKDKAASQKKTELETNLKLAEAVGSDAIALDAAYRDALGKAGGDTAKAVAAVTPVYEQVRARWKGMGHELPAQFSPTGNLASIGQAKEVTAYLKGLQPTPSDLGKLLAERDQLPAGDPRRANYDAAIGKRTDDPTELARLFKEREALPADSPVRATYDRVLAGYKAGKGDTAVTVNTGPMNPGKTAGNKIDEGILDTTQGLMRLETIASQFRPEYQTFLTRGANWWSAVKEKAGADLKVKEKKDLEEFSAYKRNSIDSMNQYIKSVTGAAMTDAEAKRILRGLPNPGSGLFDGDSPTEFKAKMDDALKQTKVAVARLAYLKRNGMSLEDGKGNATVPLEGMPKLINERGTAIEGELRKAQPNVGKAELGRAVRRQLAVEFGLASD